MRPVFASLIVSFLSVPAAADEGAEKAASELRSLLAQKVSGREAVGARREAIVAWLRDVDERQLDLAEHGYLRAVALHFDRRIEEAGNVIIGYLRRYKKPPTKEYDDSVGRICFAALLKTIDAGRLDTAEQLTTPAIRFTTKPSFLYSTVGAELRKKGSSDALKLLNRVLLSVLMDTRIDDQAKQDVLERVYAAPLSLQRREKLADKGVPQLPPRTAAGQTPPVDPTAPKRRGTTTAKTFREFSGTDLDGAKVAVKDYRGKVLLIDYWATWCGPCIREMPNVVSCYDKYRDRGFEVLGVSLDRAGTEQHVRNVAKKLGMKWKHVYDGKGWGADAARLNNVRSIPATYLIDATGKVRHTNLRGKRLEKRVAELIAELEKAR